MLSSAFSSKNLTTCLTISHDPAQPTGNVAQDQQRAARFWLGETPSNKLHSTDLPDICKARYISHPWTSMHAAFAVHGLRKLCVLPGSRYLGILWDGVCINNIQIIIK